MKTFFKAVGVIIGLFFFVGCVLPNSIANIIKDELGGTELSNVYISTGEETIIPRFDIVSQEYHQINNLGRISAEKFEWWRLNIGEVHVHIEYDSSFRLGVRRPDLIPLERIGDTIYVNEADINVELLYVKIYNYRYIDTCKSNVFVINNNSEEFLFDALNQIEREFEENITNNQRNLDSAKLNFMMNYENLCRALGLNVVWR